MLYKDLSHSQKLLIDLIEHEATIKRKSDLKDFTIALAFLLNKYKKHNLQQLNKLVQLQ